VNAVAKGLGVHIGVAAVGGHLTLFLTVLLEPSPAVSICRLSDCTTLPSFSNAGHNTPDYQSHWSVGFMQLHQHQGELTKMATIKPLTQYHGFTIDDTIVAALCVIFISVLMV